MIKIISAPFGNYIKKRGWIQTIGTYTLYPRPGRFWRAIKTIRYDRRRGGWINNLGLRNPGIDSIKSTDGKIISIHGFNDDEWQQLIEITRPMECFGIELNIGCPNVTRQYHFPNIRLDDKLRDKLIVKLPPVGWQTIYREAFDAGIVAFHCCNALPINHGALSGKPVMPYSLGVIQRIKTGNIFVIGGGGILTKEDAEKYVVAGADAISIGSGWFTWWRVKLN